LEIGFFGTEGIVLEAEHVANLVSQLGWARFCHGISVNPITTY
jgi:hypothetical protein